MATKKKPTKRKAPKKFPVIDIKIEEILATAATQMRKKLDRTTIKEYVEAAKNGAVFPPVVVFCEKGGDRHILADGFHRLHAFVDAEIATVKAEVREGGQRDAMVYAMGCNEQHGLRRTNADKRFAVEMLLKDPELMQLSQKEMAEICRVTRQTIGRVRDDMVLAEGRKKQKPGTPTDPTPEDHRPSRPEPTQKEAETGELRKALSLIMALPYGGEDANDKLDLNKDDTANLEYVAAWCSHAVLVMRK